MAINISDEFSSNLGELSNYKPILGGFAPEPTFVDTYDTNLLNQKYTFAQGASVTSFSTVNSYLQPTVNNTILAAIYDQHYYTDVSVSSKFRMDSAEKQLVTLTGSPTGGTFTLTYKGQTTASINYNDNAGTVQTRLTALSTIGGGGVTVTGASPQWTVAFTANSVSVPLMSATPALTGGTSPTVVNSIQFDYGLGVKFVDSINYVYAKTDGRQLTIWKLVNNVPTQLAGPLNMGQITQVAVDYWLVTKVLDNLVTLQFWQTDPTLGGSPTNTLTYTLSGSEATIFGAGVRALNGIGYWQPRTLFARVDDLRVAPLAPSSTGTTAINTILGNKHIDIRTFVENTGFRASSMADLEVYHQFEVAYSQRLDLGSSDAGTFTLTYEDSNGIDHAQIFNFDVTANQLETGLRNMFAVSSGINVSGASSPFIINFDTKLHYVPLLLVDSDLTAGGNPTQATVTNVNSDTRYLQTASPTDPQFTQESLEFIRITEGENWLLTGSSVYEQGDLEVAALNNFNYWSGIRINISQSIDAFDLTSAIPNNPINLLQLESDISNIHISAAFPNLLNLPLNLASCSLQFSSDPQGVFGNGHDSLSIALSLYTTGAGSEAEFNTTLLTFDTPSIDWTKITGVKIHLEGNANPPTGQFIMLSLRALIPANWTPTLVDVNTVRGSLGVPTSIDGNTDTSGYVRFLPLIRGNSFDSSGRDDPKPSDGALSLRFRTGDFGVKKYPNRLQLFFRENPNDYVAPTSDQWMIGELEFGQNFISLKRYSVLRTSSPFVDSMVGPLVSNPQSAATPPAGSDKPAPGTLAPLKANTNYLFQAEVQNTGFRLAIFELDENGVVNFTHYETGFENHPEWERVAGRVGWFIDLQDYDTYVDYFRSSSTAYSILRTVIFKSHTPVDGAQIVVNSSPPVQLFNNFTSIHNTDTLVLDNSRRTDINTQTYRFVGSSINVTNGMQSNPAYFDDWENLTIEFDIWLPPDMSRNPDIKPSLYLIDPIDAGNIDSSRTIGPISILSVPNSFTTNRIDLSIYKFKPVSYYEVHFVSQQPHSYTWWNSNMQINRRTVSWEIRAVDNGEWIPFGDMINDTTFALHLGRDLRGTQLQLQARALSQDAWIAEYKLMPHYAELGRVILT